tara:strand:- start:236 stop:541 length:306 start_codon:yes stop_codon:yes gene_type:complete
MIELLDGTTHKNKDALREYCQKNYTTKQLARMIELSHFLQKFDTKPRNFYTDHECDNLIEIYNFELKAKTITKITFNRRVKKIENKRPKTAQDMMDSMFYI